MRVPLVFADKEAAVLLAMYEAENGTYDSYSLTWKLNPTVENGTPPALVAFTETRDATERLILHSLVRGNRLTGADGVYFNNLNLTPKGEKMAIKQKKSVKDLKAMEEVVDQVNSLLAEIPRSSDKK